MNTKVIILIAFLVGLLGGALLSKQSASEIAHEDHDMHEDHVHEIRNIDVNPPTVDLSITGNESTGYDAQITTTNLTFAPQNANGDNVDGEGHAHIYIDGKKINRVYGEWYHIGKLDAGTHEISVRLSSNDHFELAVNNGVITDSEIIAVEEHYEGDGHDHEEDDDHNHMDVEMHSEGE